MRILLCSLLMLCLPTGGACAGGVEFVDGVIFEAPPGTTVLAGYGRVRNTTGAPVTVVAVASADFERVEIHRTSMVDGVMRMRRLKGFEVPANGEIAFERGGMHLMLFTPKRRLKAGDTVRVDVSYGAPGPLIATFVVRRVAPTESSWRSS